MKRKKKIIRLIKHKNYILRVHWNHFFFVSLFHHKKDNWIIIIIEYHRKKMIIIIIIIRLVNRPILSLSLFRYKVCRFQFQFQFCFVNWICHHHHNKDIYLNSLVVFSAFLPFDNKDIKKDFFSTENKIIINNFFVLVDHYHYQDPISRYHDLCNRKKNFYKKKWKKY